MSHLITLVLVPLAFVGCRNVFGLDDPLPSVDGDADAPSNVDARLCWGTSIRICLAAMPTGSVELTGTLDTTNDSRCQVIDGHCVIAATTITIASTNVSVIGTRPLVLIASDRVIVDGVLDASSRTTPTPKRGPGVGAASATCSVFASNPTFTTSPTAATGGGGGGGAGGSFTGGGGIGGANNGNALGGGPQAAVTGDSLRAGCAGQSGAARAGMTPSAGGFGGGALALIAGSEIEVRAASVINAAGSAGEGGRCQNCGDPLDNADAYGAGGGGSGGMIVLDASTITNLGRIFADGGGGGEGASRSVAGLHGQEPPGTAAALGGDGANSNGGNGGSGSFATSRAGIAGSPGSSSSPGGGGGGGGGAGAIRIRGTVTNSGTISPST